MALEDMRWVSCSKDVNPMVARTRHLISVRPDALTTLCGSTANDPKIWRKDSRKEDCPTCSQLRRAEEKYQRMLAATAKKDPIAEFNSAQNKFFSGKDKAGQNDRSDVTSGSGYSRFDTDEEIEQAVAKARKDAFEMAAKIAERVGHHWFGAGATASFEISEALRALAADNPNE